MSMILYINYMDEIMMGCPVELLEESFPGFDRNVKAIHCEWNGYDCIQDFIRFEGETVEECVNKAKIMFGERIRKYFELNKEKDGLTDDQMRDELSRLNGEVVGVEYSNLGIPWEQRTCCESVKLWYFGEGDDVSGKQRLGLGITYSFIGMERIGL